MKEDLAKTVAVDDLERELAAKLELLRAAPLPDLVELFVLDLA